MRGFTVYTQRNQTTLALKVFNVTLLSHLQLTAGSSLILLCLLSFFHAIFWFCLLPSFFYDYAYLFYVYLCSCSFLDNIHISLIMDCLGFTTTILSGTHGPCGTTVSVSFTGESPRLCLLALVWSSQVTVCGSGGDSVERYSQHPDHQVSLASL